MGKICYNVLFEAILHEKHSICDATSPKVTQFLVKKFLEHSNLDEWAFENEQLQGLESKVRSFASSLKKKWKESRYGLQNFLVKNKDWLNNELDWSEKVKNPPESKPSRGRPLKNFNDLSERGKRLRTEELRATASSEELISAAIASLNIEGKRAAADLVAQATQFSPERPIKLRQVIKKSQEQQEPVPYTPDEALDLCINCRLSKRTYLVLRKEAKARGADLYPSYDRLLEAKSRRDPEGINNDDEAEKDCADDCSDFRFLTLAKFS